MKARIHSTSLAH